MNRKYTDEMCAWLAERYPSDAPVAELCAEFERLFPGSMTPSRLFCWASSRGVRRSRALRWTDEMRAFFREVAPGHTEAEIRAAFAGRFGVELTEGQIGNAKTRLGVRSGTHGGRFEKGRESHSKGRTWDELGIPKESRERMARTQFRAGDVPHNARPLGFERVTRGGYVEVKVKDGLQTKANDNYRMKHHVAWEQANGRPVPPGHVVAFADGDKRNFDPENLVCVPRSAWAVVQRQGVPYCDRETLEAAVALAKVRSALRAARGKEVES